jgi:hypothetical protein
MSMDIAKKATTNGTILREMVISYPFPQKPPRFGCLGTVTRRKQGANAPSKGSVGERSPHQPGRDEAPHGGRGASSLHPSSCRSPGIPAEVPMR